MKICLKISIVSVKSIHKPNCIVKVRFIVFLKQSRTKVLILGVRNWKRKTLDMEIWRGLIQKAKIRYQTVAPYKKKNKILFVNKIFIV